MGAADRRPGHRRPTAERTFSRLDLKVGLPTPTHDLPHAAGSCPVPTFQSREPVGHEELVVAEIQQRGRVRGVEPQSDGAPDISKRRIRVLSPAGEVAHPNRATTQPAAETPAHNATEVDVRIVRFTDRGRPAEHVPTGMILRRRTRRDRSDRDFMASRCRCRFGIGWQERKAESIRSTDRLPPDFLSQSFQLGTVAAPPWSRP